MGSVVFAGVVVGGEEVVAAVVVACVHDGRIESRGGWESHHGLV